MKPVERDANGHPSQLAGLLSIKMLDQLLNQLLDEFLEDFRVRLDISHKRRDDNVHIN